MRRAKASANTAATGISKSMGFIKASVAGLVAGLSIGLFTSVVKGALEYAGSLQEVATQVGVTAKELQTLRYAAGQNGVSTEQLETAMAKLTVTMSKANAGSEKAQKAYKAVGVELSDLKTKSKSEILGQIADEMLKTGGAAKNAAAGVAIMGKGFLAMAPLLDLGSAGISELSLAAEKLGIVLSDEQIAKADETADKLEALKTVLMANIAGAVANNSDAILGLANALVTLINTIPQAIQGWKNMAAEFNAAVFAGVGMEKRAAEERGKYRGPNGETLAGPSVTVALPPARPFVKAKPAGGDINQFLAGGGGSKKAKHAAVDHSAENALRDQNQFDQELRRAQMDVLRAQQDLSRDYVERTSIGIAILNAEKSAHDAEMKYQIALFKLSKGKQGQSEVQAAQLQAEYDIKDSLERQKLLQEEQEQRQQDVQELTQHDYERRRDVLQSMSAVAETASERREIELQLLKLAYEAKRQALQSIIDTSKDEKAKEDARRDLVNLNSTYGNDRQGVLNSTRGPLEDYFKSLPDTVAKADEALQRLQVEGFQGLINSAVALTEGFGAAKRSLLSTLTSIVQGILRMRLEAGLASASKGGSFFKAFLGIASAASGVASSGLGNSIYPVTNGVDPLAPLPPFARGGSFRIRGRKGTDRNLLSLNRVPIARVNYGERIDIANDNVNGGGRPYFDLRGAVMTADLLSQMNQIGEVSTGRGAVLGAAGAEERGIRRARQSIP